MNNSGSREPDRGPGWMRCAFWAVCAACERRVEVGQWQALARRTLGPCILPCGIERDGENRRSKQPVAQLCGLPIVEKADVPAIISMNVNGLVQHPPVLRLDV